MVLDITWFKYGSQKLIDYIEQEKMPNGIMYRFFSKVNQKVTMDDAQCPSTRTLAVL